MNYVISVFRERIRNIPTFVFFFRTVTCVNPLLHVDALARALFCHLELNSCYSVDKAYRHMTKINQNKKVVE